MARSLHRKKNRKKKKVKARLAVYGLISVAIALVVMIAMSQQKSVVLAPDQVLQSETFLVKVLDEKNTITGMLGSKNLAFFRSQNNKDWVAIVGVGVREQPGNYLLIVEAPGKALFEKNIIIAAKEFPATALQFTQRQIQEGYTAPKLVKNIITQSNTPLAAAMATITPKAYFTKPFTNPLDLMKVRGKYGDIRGSGANNIQHLGVDLKAPSGTPVYAVNSGTVALAKFLPNYGNTMVIDHGFGIYSLYLHLSKLKVSLGDAVIRGDTIALSGNTGYTLGPHLHFSMKIKGDSVDPLEFIKATQNGW